MVNGVEHTSTLKRNNTSTKTSKFRPGNIVVRPPSRSSSPSNSNSNSDSSSNTRSHTHTRNTSHSTGLHTPTTPGTPNGNGNALRSRLISMISPRSSNYERLEGGHGPSRTGAPGNAKRLAFGWKKFALAAGVIIGLVYFFGPREARVPWRSSGSANGKGKDWKPGYPYPDDVTTTTDAFENHPEQTHPPPSFPLDVKPVSPPKPHPTSYTTDPNPNLTTYCTAPSSPHLPLTQWALMIDAGSTGSRIHIYKFNNCFGSPSYEYEVFKMITPGLSSFAAEPSKAAESLDVLLDEAVRVVPRALWGCTPVAVKATAGLRLLRGSQSQDILRAVEGRLRAKYPFQLPEKDGVVIMDGKDEGVYAWITANYLLDTIKADTPKDTPTYAVLDLGGASTQIVFEPTFSPSHQHQKLEEGEHKYTLKFGGQTHTLYQHSYLGYGLMRARQHVHTLVDFMASLRVPSERERKSGIVANPCLARGTKREVEVGGMSGEGPRRKVVMSGDEIGGFEACEKVVQLVLAKDAICEMKPCSFNGVYQPSLLDSFPHGKVLLLSYFYDRLAPLLPPAPSSSTTSPPQPPPKLTVSTLAQLANLTCLGPASWASHPLWSANHDLLEEMHGRPEWCLDLTFMHALLRLGYEFEDGREVMIGKQVGGTELGWCLGAAIELVGGGEVKCRDGDFDGDVGVGAGGGMDVHPVD